MKTNSLSIVDQKRGRLLRAAMQVFLRDGYDGVSMDSLADAAGVARRTLYNQFPEGKEAIFRAAVEHFWDGFPRFDRKELDGVPAADGLLRIGVAIATFWQGEDVVAFLRLAIAELRRFPDLMAPVSGNGKLPLMDDLAAYLKSEAKAGRLNVPDVELAALQFFGLVCEPLLWPQVVGMKPPLTARTRAEVVPNAVTVFLAGYCVSSKRKL